MVTAQRHENGSSNQRVLVSNAAANMVSSLYPSSKAKANATLAKIKLSVLDSSKIQKIAGVENAFVAHADNLFVVFKNEGDSVVITSILPRA